MKLGIFGTKRISIISISDAVLEGSKREISKLVNCANKPLVLLVLVGQMNPVFHHLPA